MYVTCPDGIKTICPGPRFLLCRKHVFLIYNTVLYNIIGTVLHKHADIYVKMFQIHMLQIYLCIYLRICACECVCTCMSISVHVYMCIHKHTYTRIFIYMYTYMSTYAHLNHFLLFLCISIMRILFHSVWNYSIWRKQIAVTELICEG